MYKRQHVHHGLGGPVGGGTIGAHGDEAHGELDAEMCIRDRFNALTGSNQFVGNWPGVTVEKKEGKLTKHADVVIMDLPGIYSRCV